MSRLVLLLVASGAAQRLTDAEELALKDNVEDLCRGRPPTEYFRLTTTGDCRDVVRCDRLE